MDFIATVKPGNRIVPTWIELPKQCGSGRVTVLEIFLAKQCPCGMHPARIFILEGNHMCVECKSAYLWYKAPEDLDRFKKIMC